MDTWGAMTRRAVGNVIAGFLLLAAPAMAAESPAERISGFRVKHGEVRVVRDATLDRIALEQARAMAAKDTLGQWIDSSEHRKNLLLHNASRVGVASAKDVSGKRTYWAMVIAGDYEPPK